MTLKIYKPLVDKKKLKMTRTAKPAFDSSTENAPSYSARVSVPEDLQAVQRFFKTHTDKHIHPRKIGALKEACAKGRVIIIKDPNDNFVGMSARYAHEINGFKFQELGSVMIDPSATRQGLSSQMIALQIAAAYLLDKEKPDILVADFVEGNTAAQDMFEKMNWTVFDGGALKEKCYTTHTAPFDGKTNWCMFAETDLEEMARRFLKIFTEKNNLAPREPLFSAYNRMVSIVLGEEQRPKRMGIAHLAALKAAGGGGQSLEAA